MLKLTSNEPDTPEGSGSVLDELAREGARRMIMGALELEVAEYIDRCQSARDECGNSMVVRNGHAVERRLLTGAGSVKVKAPRINDKRPDRKFTSAILPPYMRRSPNVSEVLPILYLKGISSGDFQGALEALLGKDAAGLSAGSIGRLKAKWLDEYKLFKQRYLGHSRYAYVFCDGVNVKVRLGEDPKVSLLVVIGVNQDGSKELLAVEEGYRESKESWASALRDLKRRGMEAPLLSVADGHLGFWAAATDVWPDTGEQRCWVHKIANVLDKLPKRLQGKAKSMLHEAMGAPDRDTALLEIEIFKEEYQAKYPKAVNCLVKDTNQLLTFFDFPAEHWVHLRTTNPIESSFATVKARTKTTKGAGSREAALTMAYKLLTEAQKRWRRINGAHLVIKVLEGVEFRDGIEQVKVKTEEKAVA